MFSENLKKKSDEELMTMVQGGDERALAELYGRYAKKLVRYFHRMLWKDENKAQDFLHDLFVKIIERPHRFEADRKFSTWIYSAAFNMCKNEYRKQNLRRPEQHGLSEIAEAIQPDADQQEFQLVLAGILDQSEENDRNLFILRYELELPLAHIASIMDCPEGTIKSRLFTLKKKLAVQLQKVILR